MPRLFSYGTLQLPQVQRDRFGRLLDGAPDALVGHRTLMIEITDPDVIATSGTSQHPLVVPSADATDVVEGTVFEISDDELPLPTRTRSTTTRAPASPCGQGKRPGCTSRRRTSSPSKD